MPKVEDELDAAAIDEHRSGASGVFRLLETEHSRIDELMRRVATAGGSARRTLYGQLERELAAQNRAKEEALYPSLQKLEEAAELVDESIEDHAAMAELMERLDALDADTEGFTDLFDALMLEVRDNVDMEENELFPLVEDLVGDTRSRELAARYETVRRESLRAA